MIIFVWRYSQKCIEIHIHELFFKRNLTKLSDTNREPRHNRINKIAYEEVYGNCWRLWRMNALSTLTFVNRTI